MKGYIKGLIASIEKNLETGDVYGAISGSIILLETCVRIDYPQASDQEFIAWLDMHLGYELDLKIINDLIQVRSLLLEGASIEESTSIPIINKMNDSDFIIDSFTGDCILHSFVNVNYFCNKIIEAGSHWLKQAKIPSPKIYYGVARTLIYGEGKYLIVGLCDHFSLSVVEGSNHLNFNEGSFRKGCYLVSCSSWEILVEKFQIDIIHR